MSEDSQNTEYIKQIKWYGHLSDDDNGEACGGCLNQEEFLKSNPLPPDVQVVFNDAYDPNSEEYLDRLHVREIPYTEACLINKKTGQPEKCKKIRGFNPERLKQALDFNF